MCMFLIPDRTIAMYVYTIDQNILNEGVFLIEVTSMTKNNGSHYYIIV